MLNVILAFVFIFSLLSLAMIFGDRLSLFGNVNDRWLLAPFEMVSRFWAMLCELFDRAFCFVFDHFWWVTATASGSVGVVLISVIMLSSLSQEAAAVRRDEMVTMNVGGVLDHTAAVSAKEVLRRTIESKEDVSSHLVDQSRTPGNRFAVEEFYRRPDLEVVPIEQPYTPVSEYSSHLIGTSDQFHSKLRLGLSPFVEISGKRIADPAFDEMISRTLYDVGRDEWQAFSALAFDNRRFDHRPNLPDDSIGNVDRLLESVRIVPGDIQVTQTLDVQKFVPENPPAGEFDVRLRLRNRGNDTLSGLVIREQIPMTAFVKDMQPRGVYRDATAVWVVNNLRAGEERDLVLTVSTEDQDRFESWTEVSAASAVRARTVVDGGRPIRLPPVDREQPRDPFPPRRPVTRPVTPARLPNVKLRLLTDPVRVDVNKIAVVRFEIINVGDADAKGVSLRVNLPNDVDHKDLVPNDIFRRVEANISVLKPDEHKKMELRVRPTRSGEHLVTALLMLRDEELDFQSFDVIATRSTESDTEFAPVDEVVPPPQPDRGFR